MADKEKTILDWDLYVAKAREVAAEGLVLLENHNSVLPLNKGVKVSLFGRIQTNYYKSGVGSGGMVNVDAVIGIPEGLINSGEVTLNEELRQVYADWEKDNLFDEGCGWGSEPWSQKEMPLTDELVKKASENSDVAIVIIGRTAGEDRDMAATEGSYLLTSLEVDMLKKVRASFDKMVVLLNVGGIIDMSFVDTIAPDAVMYVWQGGMIGGDGVADVLTGKVTPSGKLSDTIAYELSDYAATENFGDKYRNFYKEDIYVGYRYFETFAKDKVRYPFGYGLSYTSFSIETISKVVDVQNLKVAFEVKVKNTGAVAGKEVVQIYVEAPQGKLGKAVRSLVSFAKTKNLAPGEEEMLSFDINCKDFASYDDRNATGHKSCFVLEEGTYTFYIGSDVRSAKPEENFTLDELIVVEELSEAYAPILDFDIMKPVATEDGYKVSYEKVTLASDAGKERLSKREIETNVEVVKPSGENYMLSDVVEGKITLETFVDSLSDYDLAALCSGEGMSSPLVTPGTAAAFGGVSESLQAKGVPAVCCADGPSGIRMDCGTRAFSLPNGLMIGSTFNLPLVEELYSFTGMELAGNHVECLLGPGINIQRHPMNGRNFEYFSEDPYLTGSLATAMLKGLQTWNVTGVMKHFCGNNQETGRRVGDSVMSERALREIYLKGFRMVVDSGYGDAVMTSYGIVNGVRTSMSRDLNTKILRDEWGFDGIVMTDWWAHINFADEVSPEDGYYYTTRAQNDIFMVTSKGGENPFVDKSLEIVENNSKLHGYMRTCAMNVLKFVMKTRAMKRLMDTEIPVVFLNRPEEDEPDDLTNMQYIPVDEYFEMDLTYKKSKKGTNYVIPINMKHAGTYEVTLSGSSMANEVAQIPCTLFGLGTVFGTFTFNGTGGKEVTLKRKCLGYGRNVLFRIRVGGNGVDLTKFTFRYISDSMEMPKND